MGRGPAVHSGRLGSLDLTASTTDARTRSGGGFQCYGVIRGGAVNPPFPARSSARSRAPSPSQQSCHSRPTLGSQERLELGDGLQWLRSPGPAGRLLAVVSARSRPRSLETFGEAWGRGMGGEAQLSRDQPTGSPSPSPASPRAPLLLSPTVSSPGPRRALSAARGWAGAACTAAEAAGSERVRAGGGGVPVAAPRTHRSADAGTSSLAELPEPRALRTAAGPQTPRQPARPRGGGRGGAREGPPGGGVGEPAVGVPSPPRPAPATWDRWGG
ncbi:uncharacterized protein LOC113220506 [Piliocolobus tephrosceles]|uniref:uncharacterized protein LOC113220506 n=1 Tax=Piliocolobus tephrosceles TaxID=591936 RepID=UPI001301781E|nr:uncharacterized protein LOC113220506 [Piliocolobus tephrosceles]